jgi:hypothetical protein
MLTLTCAQVSLCLYVRGDLRFDDPVGTDQHQEAAPRRHKILRTPAWCLSSVDTEMERGTGDYTSPPPTVIREHASAAAPTNVGIKECLDYSRGMCVATDVVSLWPGQGRILRLFGPASLFFFSVSKIITSQGRYLFTIPNVH